MRVLDVSGSGPLERASFMAYSPAFKGGVSVAGGDLDGDGIAEVVTGTGKGGGPHVRAFKITETGVVEIASWMAYSPNFTGGVSVAVGDIDGDGMAEVITGAGPGGASHVRVFDLGGSTPVEEAAFMAYAAAFVGGVNVWAGNVDTDPQAEVVTAPQGNGGSHVRVLDLSSGLVEQAGFFAYGAGMTQGLRPAYGDVDGDGAPDLVTTTGTGGPARLDLRMGVEPASRTGFYVF